MYVVFYLYKLATSVVFLRGMKNLLNIISFLFIQYSAVCQNTIRGKVVSDKGLPLAGASLFIPSTTIGAITNKDGEFVVQNIPVSSFKLAVSFVGYQVSIQNISPALQKERIIIYLKPKSDELSNVVIRNYERNGWDKWGKVFISEFIGESAFAQHCSILNKDVIKFVFLAENKELRAYATEPLIVDNTALGYRILVELIYFKCYTNRHEADYKMFTFFTPLNGNEDEIVAWKQNRELAYSLSLMHFMRSLFTGNIKQEGFDIRMLYRKWNVEKKRVLSIYNDGIKAVKDSLGKVRTNDKEIEKMVEKRIKKDSVKLYRRILDQEDWTENIDNEKMGVKQIIRHTDTGTAILHFPNYLHVAYKRKKEPSEYFNFRNQVATMGDRLPATSIKSMVKDWPKTVLKLTEDIPIEISESGYFNNSNLMLDGFWGWWEKLATKLPYEYNL
jgi:hypothetical protein